MEYIEIKNSLDSKLQTYPICSIRILNILKIIAKTRFSKIEKHATLTQGAQENRQATQYTTIWLYD